MSHQTLLIIAACGGGLLLMIIAFLLLSEPNDSGKMKKRLARVSGLVREKSETAKNKSLPAQTLRRTTKDSNNPLLDKLIKSFLPNPEKLRARLEQTGRNISVGRYLAINGLLSFVFYVVFAVGLGWATPTALMAGIAIGLYIPHFVVGNMGAKRLRKFLANFPEAIDTICRGLRSGLPISESIGAVGREMPDPVGIEFRRISDGVRMGRSLDEAMWDVSKRLATPEYRFFIIAMAIQKETGGNLAETLGNLADLLRKRRQLRLKIRAMSAEARASAMIIGSLPFLMFTLLMVVNASYVMTLIDDPRGNILLGGGLTTIGIGVLVMRKMISFEI